MFKKVPFDLQLLAHSDSNLIKIKFNKYPKSNIIDRLRALEEYNCSFQLSTASIIEKNSLNYNLYIPYDWDSEESVRSIANLLEKTDRIHAKIEIKQNDSDLSQTETQLIFIGIGLIASLLINFLLVLVIVIITVFK